MKYFILIILFTASLMLSISAEATNCATKQWTDEKGNVHWSGEICGDSNEQEEQQVKQKKSSTKKSAYKKALEPYEEGQKEREMQSSRSSSSSPSSSSPYSDADLDNYRDSRTHDDGDSCHYLLKEHLYDAWKRCKHFQFYIKMEEKGYPPEVLNNSIGRPK